MLRDIGWILAGVLGALFVLFLVLALADLKRAAGKGPRWKRRLVIAGIFFLSSLGLSVGNYLTSPTCYAVDMSVDLPAYASMIRIEKQFELLIKMHKSGKIDNAVMDKVCKTLMEDIEILGDERELSKLSPEERRKAEIVRRDAIDFLNPKPTCYR